MALVLKDRVQETATPNTTVSFSCNGPVTGFQAFSTIGNGNTTYYTAVDGSGNWESGLGTYTTAGDLVTRTTISASSNAGSAVTFSGAVSLFVNYPATKSVNLDASGNVSALGTVASGTWQGSTVGVAYGGTGVTTSTGANSVVLRDADQNIAINKAIQTRAVTTSAATITTLTTASAYWQILTGTTTQTYKLPDATSLPTGFTYVFDNDSTGNLTITDNAGATIDVVAAGGYSMVFLETNGTVGGGWGRAGMIPAEVNWGTNSLDLGGSTLITNGTWNGTTIAYNYGGTGLTSFAAANNALYSTSASALTAGTLPVLAGGTGVTTSTGTGNNVLSTSPTLVTPILGTPTSGTLTSCTGLPLTTGVTGTLTATNGGTGVAGTLTGILYGNGTSAHSVATTAQMLTGMGVANTTTSGYLSSTDWNTFNGKQAAGSYVTVGGALGTPSSGTLTNCTFPTLNQNTTGSSGSCTGNAATVTNGIYTTTIGSYAVKRSSNVGNIDFNSYTSNSQVVGFNTPNTNGPSGVNYSTMLVMQERGDTSSQFVIDYNTGHAFSRGIYLTAPTYSPWRTILDDGNYNSYAPSLTGGGASGTWGINVTGSSGSCTGNAATATSLVGSAFSAAANGYYKDRTSGLIIQWGTVNSGGAGSFTITLPIAFPSACFAFGGAAHTASGFTGGLQYGSLGTASISGYVGSAGNIVSWIAIGY